MLCAQSAADNATAVAGAADMPAAETATEASVETAAASSSSSGGSFLALPVREIRIEGLKKTRNSYLQSLLKKYRLIPAGEIDVHAVETSLQSEGIFESVQVQVLAEADSAILQIQVKEKQSFIPLPFAASSNGRGMAGLFLLDTNAFGVKDQFVVGGIFSSSTRMGMASFAKPSLGLTQPGFSLAASCSKNNASYEDLHENDVLSYDALSFSGQLAVTDRLTEHSQASLGLGYSQGQVDELENFSGYQTTVEDWKALALAANWGMASNDWNGWFLSTKSLALQGKLRFYYGEKTAPSAGGRLQIEEPFLSPRLRFVSQISAAASYREHISQLEKGSAVGLTILPDDFCSSRLVGSSAGFEWAFKKVRWALFSVYGNYQLSLAEDCDDTMSFTHGFSGGTRMYLTKIAFPALAFGFAYNVSLSMFKYSASFGLSM